MIIPIKSLIPFALAGVSLTCSLSVDANDRGSAVVDIFRVDKGLIVEHWDVEQAVPAQPKNRNTMF